MSCRGDILLVGAPTVKTRLNEYFFADPGDVCEICNVTTGADLRYQQGETDSFGFEVLVTCKTCLEKATGAQKAWDRALDIEDKVAPDGQLYVFSAGDQTDRVRYCFVHSKKLREVVSKKRGYEVQCEPYGGLYPRDAQVELADEATVLARAARVRKVEQAEIDEARRNYAFSGDDDS